MKISNNPYNDDDEDT